MGTLVYAATTAHGTQHLMHAIKLQYRADVEGLRAVAILLVVAAHANLPGLQGGFVGVDVFFVLSGFLITSLLVRELETTGSVALAQFYLRRLRRLLPALVFMLLCTCAAAAALLAPFEQVEQAPAARSATVWLSNMYFATRDLDYFGASAETNLFLHTWSLGVEEQFYLLWPALLLFLAGAWGWQGRKCQLSHLAPGLAVVALASLSLGLWWTSTSPRLGFYLMPARAWQFALGGLVSLLAARITTEALLRPSHALLFRWTPWLGISAILLAGVLFDRSTHYPGWHALLPSLGTAAILLVGSLPQPHPVIRVLSTRPMQALGSVSYAWYLWHWPVLLLGATIVPDTPLHRLGLVLVSLVLAAFSFRYVESPIRRSGRGAATPLIGLSVAAIAMAAIIGLVFFWQQTASSWSEEPGQRKYQLARISAPRIEGDRCDEWFHSAAVRPCTFGDPEASKVAVVMGDSIGLQWFPALRRIYASGDWKLVVLTKSACPIVDATYVYPVLGREYVECSTWRRDALAWIRNTRPDVILFGSSATYPFDQEQWTDGTTRILAAVAGSTGRIRVLRATPTLPFDGPNCLARQAWRPAMTNPTQSCVAPYPNPHAQAVYRWQLDAVRQVPNATMLDLNPLICREGLCAADRDGEVVFRDDQHLAASFVESIAGLVEIRMHSTRQGAGADQPSR